MIIIINKLEEEINAFYCQMYPFSTAKYFKLREIYHRYSGAAVFCPDQPSDNQYRVYGELHRNPEDGPASFSEECQGYMGRLDLFYSLDGDTLAAIDSERLNEHGYEVIIRKKK